MSMLLSYLIDFKRSIGLGVVLAMVFSLSHYVPALSSNTTMREESVEQGQARETQSRIVAMARRPAMAEPTADDPARDPDSVMAQDEFFRTLEMDENGLNWRKDWWKYLCIVLVGLLAVFLGIRLVKMIFRLVIFLICMVTGFLGAFYIGPHLTPLLRPHIPERVLDFMSPELVGYVAGFALAYLVVTIVMALLPKTVHGGGSRGK